MKKFLLVLMIVTMLFLMCSCNTTIEESGKGEVSSAVETIHKTDDDNASSTSSQKLDIKSTYEFGEKMSEFPHIEKVVLCDTDKYKITAQNLEYSEAFSDLTVNLLFENKSDKAVSFDRGFFFVNDWNIENDVWYMSTTVQPGEVKEARFSISLWCLSVRHISTINTISFNFFVDGKKTDLFTIKTDAKTSDSGHVFEGPVVYDEYGVKAVLPESGCLYENGVYMYVENTSDKAVFVRNAITPVGDEPHQSLGKGVILYPHTKEVYYSQESIYKIVPGSELNFSVSSNEYDLEKMTYDSYSMKYGKDFVLKVVK